MLIVKDEEEEEEEGGGKTFLTLSVHGIRDLSTGGG